MSSKTPWRMLWRLIEEVFFQCTKESEIFHRASLMFIYFILDIIHSHLESIQESRMSSKTPWRMLRRLLAECPPPVHIEQQISHWASVIILTAFRNQECLQDYLVDALETHRKISFSRSPKNLKYMSFLILEVQSKLNSILESRMSSKTPWRTQRKIGLLND